MYNEIIKEKLRVDFLINEFSIKKINHQHKIIKIISDFTIDELKMMIGEQEGHIANLKRAKKINEILDEIESK